MTARSGGKVDEMVFWYNFTPNSEGLVPAISVYGYDTRLPGMLPLHSVPRSSKGNPYSIGDIVYKKPGNARCMTPWSEGVVTGIVADTVVEVDGMNRHISDVRRANRRGGSAPRNGAEEHCAKPREIEFDEQSLHETPHDDAQISQDQQSAQRSIDSSLEGEESNEEGDETDNVGNESSRPIRDRQPPAWLADFYVE